MTNEEAQVTLANFKRYISGGGAIDRQANQAIDMAIKALGQPERKRGKWIFIHPIYNNDCGGYMCSCCKSGDFGITAEYAFCPYCGADMRDPLPEPN